ncbi:MAG TPA: hypothetical protein VFV37_11885 [Luteibaculaceae bacterium]|nr:hypothetical protein [Luteibaculaceae bacterium]
MIIIVFNSCQQKPDVSPIKTPNEDLVEGLTISQSELTGILKSLNSANKVPEWWKRFKDWVNAHTGHSQIYIYGEPICEGRYSCGPCPGICFRAGLTEGGENGSVSVEDMASGLRPVALTLLEKRLEGQGFTRRLLIEIPIQYEGEFINNSIFRVESDESLPDFFSNGAGFESVIVKGGAYPTFRDPVNGKIITLTDVVVK